MENQYYISLNSTTFVTAATYFVYGCSGTLSLFATELTNHNAGFRELMIFTEMLVSFHKVRKSSAGGVPVLKVSDPNPKKWVGG